MGAKIDYAVFIEELDKKLQGYFESFGDNICCKKGCSECCERGDYPLSDIELEYLMKGFIELEPSVKLQVQENIKNMVRGGVCPFLINKECSVYKYRPIICRVHGLAYFYKGEKVKLPHCVENNKNFAKVYDESGFAGQPISANLDAPHILEGLYKEIRNMYDWVKIDESAK